MTVRQSRSADGIALVSVLWMLALLSVLAASATTKARTEARLTAWRLDKVQARHLAEGGVWYGIYRLLQRGGETQWVVDNRPYIVPVGGGEVEVRILDTAGLLNLNRASEELLTEFFSGRDGDRDEAAALAAAVRDWRDGDNAAGVPAGRIRDSLQQGAEDPEYAAAGRLYGAKDGPFTVRNELSQVLGITSEHYRRLAPLVTVHSRQSGLRIDAAPGDLLRLISSADVQLVERLLRGRAAWQARVHGAQAEWGELPGPAPGPTGTYRIGAAAGVGETVAGVVAVVAVTAEASERYRILEWRFDPPPGGSDDFRPSPAANQSRVVE